MFVLLSFSILAAASTLHPDAPRFLTMDNGAIRVEIDVHRSGFRFVGTPGGVNFLDSFSVEPLSRSEVSAPNPSGLYGEVVFVETGKTVSFASPAQVIEHSARHTVIMCDSTESIGLRLLFDLTLHATEPTARFVTRVFSATHSSQRAFVRNVTRLPRGALLHPERDSTRLKSLRGNVPIVDAESHWRLEVNAIEDMPKALLGARVSSVSEELEFTRWTRTVHLPPREGRDYYQHSNLMIEVRTADHEVLEFIQGPIGKLDGTSPLAITEEWTLELIARVSAEETASQATADSTR